MCAGAAKRLTVACRAAASERGGEYVSTTLAETFLNAEWRCSEGHVFDATIAHVLDAGAWCPRCVKSSVPPVE